MIFYRILDKQKNRLKRKEKNYCENNGSEQKININIVDYLIALKKKNMLTEMKKKYTIPVRPIIHMFGERWN